MKKNKTKTIKSNRVEINTVESLLKAQNFK